MGKRGTKRTAKSQMDPDSHHARYRRGDEFDPTSEKIKMPAGLTAEGKKCWRKVVSELHEKGLLIRLDEQTLHRYCECWAVWSKAKREVELYGITYIPKRPDGSAGSVVRPIPQVKIMKEMNETLLRIEMQFGMTPASRPELPAPKGGANSGNDIVAKMMAATRMN
jgi:P27 family predicted phage terminase small subunit